MSDSDTDPEEELFHLATEHVARQTTNIGSADLLLFYGYYKQAAEGPCEEPSPGLLQLRTRSKWQAWRNLGKISLLF